MQILIVNEFLYFVCYVIRPPPKGGVSVHDTTGVRIRTVVIIIFFMETILGGLNFFDRFYKYYICNKLKQLEFSQLNYKKILLFCRNLEQFGTLLAKKNE